MLCVMPGVHTKNMHGATMNFRWVANSLDFNKNYDASVFETTIRVVGGLLSAYDLSGDKLFLDKAQDIADRLLPAWNTPNGILYNNINLSHGNPHNPRWTAVTLNFTKFKLNFPCSII
ncbi:hypothetical protein RND71_006016 [Anisodus tanguticus]|uniref:alpha-1,2-Mannosidase n=1 Tax=Anisodus tanguticus TaxID=243964 RepID=A0AAE1VVE5_9SOLA|nr:hypothetical protein RND71_006016 [Anisodus tanguticus]